jgi:ribosomal protein S18 acetylase RimI-like enzyme
MDGAPGGSKAPIEAERVTFRRLAPSDLDSIFSRLSRQKGVEWLAAQEQGHVHVAVADVDGVPVGRAGLDLVKKANEGVAILWAAHVERAWQSRGVGSLLFAHLEAVARSRGFSVIELGVGKENPRAQALYQRRGYTVCGQQVERWSYRDGNVEIPVVEDCWLMRKSLV